MKLLALDTSSLACAVGLSCDGRVYTRYAEEDRAHTRLLLPMIRAVLDEAGIGAQALDGLVLGNGPGSFIGLRIAASVAAGIAYAAGLSVAPVSSLAAVAMAAGEPGETIAVAQDAHMGEVYLGIYELGADGMPAAVLPERLQRQGPIEDLPGGTFVAAGAGWARYPALLAANQERVLRQSARNYPLPETLLALGAAAWAEGRAVPPAEIVPAYLRHEVAQVPGRGS